MKRFTVVGTNHKIAPLAVRESIAFSLGESADALRELREHYGVPQALLLSTCNRTEIITFCERREMQSLMLDFLKRHKGVEPDFIKPHLYALQGEEAVRHLFRVASSLDSLVLGEYQILSQLKEAYLHAHQADGAGKPIHLLMTHALKVGKEVRASTGIGAGRMSVASVAVSFIRRTFDDLEKKTALLIGIGETGLITLRHLRAAGVGTIVIANRTLSKAEQAAAEFGGEALALDKLADVLPRCDIVVSQTAATEPVITEKLAAKALKKRGYRSMFMVDLAVPRDIAPEAGDLDGVYRYDIDDLQRVVEESMEQRSAEMERCEAMLEERVQDFVHIFRSHRVDPLIAGIRESTEALIEQEFSRVARKLDGLSASEQATVRTLVSRVVNKLLHQPTLAIKDEARDPKLGPEVWGFVESMFDLDGVLTKKGDGLARPSRRLTGKLPARQKGAAGGAGQPEAHHADCASASGKRTSDQVDDEDARETLRSSRHPVKSVHPEQPE